MTISPKVRVVQRPKPTSLEAAVKALPKVRRRAPSPERPPDIICFDELAEVEPVRAKP